MTVTRTHRARSPRGRRTRTCGTRRSSACSSCSRRSGSSAARPTCCSRPTSAPASASSSLRVAHRLPGAAHHAVVDVGQQRHRPAARPLAVVEGRRGRERSIAIEDRRGATMRATKGTAANETQLGNLRPAIDAALVHAAPVAGVTPPRAAVREVRGVARLPDRLPGLPDLHRRRQDQELLLAQPQVRGAQFCPTDPNTPIGAAARVRPAEAHAVRRSWPTTTARCASRWCSSSGCCRCCSSASRCSGCTGTSRTPRAQAGRDCARSGSDPGA